MTERTLAIVTAPRRNSKHWRPGTITQAELLEWLENPASRKECGNYVLGTLGACKCSAEHCNCTSRDCGHLTRTKTSIVSRSALTLDVDNPGRTFLSQLELLGSFGCAVHTTYSSAPDAPRYRVLIWLTRDVSPEEYYILATMVMGELGQENFDPGSAQPERYMFKPSAQEPAWYSHWDFPGPALNPEEWLPRYIPEDYALPAPRIHQNKRSPFELQGAPGAFNRSYTLDEAIEEFGLPYEKISDGRYHLVGAESQAGMGPISGAEGLFYSHHATDPAGGQTCSVYDLVRLHKFGRLDSASPQETPINRLPSSEEMLKFVQSDPRVMMDLLGGDFDADVDPSVSTDWRLQLQLSPRTGQMIDKIQNWDLIQKHEPVFAQLYYNEMTLSVETDGDLPWRPIGRGGPLFTATDRAELSMHIEREYKIRPPRLLLDDLVNTASFRRYQNPVRDYLNSLVWDGTPRLEESLPGVTPTEYTRLVARKVLVGAVARMLDPGCKTDFTLVLFGAEGIGKTWWINRMAKGWSATLGSISDKDTLLIMHRSWIMVSDEGHSLRKADHDAQKEFLTRTEDVFRMPYDREAVAHKRHCVIWGSTNDEVFLRRQEGNRRFLIVRCEEKVDFSALTDEYVDQIWAEVVHLYRNGEPLYMTEDQHNLAVSQREQFVEEDALAGIIQEYLDLPVPEDWDTMSPESRMEWRQGYSDGFLPAGTGRIDYVCSSQLWVEALGRRLGDARRSDLLDITNALKRIPGWTNMPGRKRVPNYGPQMVFSREAELI